MTQQDNNNNAYYLHSSSKHSTKLPYKKHELDAGYDITADFSGLSLYPGDYVFNEKEQYFVGEDPNTVILFPGGHFTCPTELCIVPQKPMIRLKEDLVFLKEIQVRGRSGLAAQGVCVTQGTGTVDSGYTGKIAVFLHNTSPFPFKIIEGQRVAQIISALTIPMEFIVKDNKDEVVSQDGRGEGGFGHTGII